MIEPGHRLDTRSPVEITERFLETYELGDEERARVWDSRLPGFGVRIGRRSVTFIVQHRVRGEDSQRVVSLGHWAGARARAADAGLRASTISVAMARGSAIETLGTMRSGEDPRGERVGEGGPTLRDGLELHVLNMRKRRCSQRSIETIEDEVPRLLASWMDRPIAEMRGADLAGVHDELTRADKKYAANRIVAHVSAIWNSLDRVHELEGRNPARAVVRNPYTPRRERIADHDLKAWHDKVLALSPVRRDLQLFVLFTGMRSEAARHARWEHLDLKRGALEVPRPKGGEERAFTLPLAPGVVAMLKVRKQENAIEFAPYGGDGGWIFPGLTRARPHRVQPVAEPKEYRSTSKHRHAPKKKHLPSMHALRRTYLSVAAEVGISDLDRHVLANHAFGRQTVNSTYIQQAFPHLLECQSKIEKALLARVRRR